MRLIKYSGVGFFALLLHLYLYHSSIIQTLDYKLYDLFNQLIIDYNVDEHSVVVIDIDDKALEEFGQWPWPRIVNAQLINQISEFNPATIGINIIFPEKDRSSPINIQNFYQNFFNYTIEMPTLPQSLKDNDLLLIESIKNSDSTLSIYLSDETKLLSGCEGLNSSEYVFKNIDTSLKSKFILCNHQTIQSSIKSFGFINAEIDDDGLFRRMPLFMRYRDMILPSFGLAMLLNIDTLNNENIKNKFSILGHSIRLDQDSYALLNFHSNLPPVISALDILQDKVPKERIQGKIVLIGSSAIGLNHSQLLANHDKISNTMIHATLIENILNDNLYVQPIHYKIINLSISFFLSLLMLLILFKRWYILILILFIFTMVTSTIWAVTLFLNNIYISIGYLWIPFLDFFFILSVSFILLYIKEQEKSHKALLASHSATLDSISLIASMHDEETGEHIQRTKNYVKVLAKYFYEKKMYLNVLTPKYINLMYEAAPLHDVGKIGIPDSILKKPGKLTDEEFEIMKTHSTLGRNVIQNTMNSYNKNEFLKVAYNIAFYHHEKWDGTGYPSGLKGDNIPLEAQFMTMADVYDALISKRRYKEAFTFEKAEEIIIQGRGTVYSPELIDAFIEVKDKFRDIALKWQDS
jgi:adenylate cyclase